ncbi:alpha/beta fold hydrolase [Nocardiopsis sp. MG754419]|uniref:alpha/beta fold hydrolase n=1 Tax=Nocardiopsis sp. MG754419 TaxID=2259865 RepID=UPI001BABC23A|nr:alpha/beta fold hydrolase [Nocardiopsis sp. MG754419]MBR8742209.1 alpha/beta hydrolase [Nocardiopsis sp. MG754419]
MSSRWIHREDTDLHILDTASTGPPVVLLHGLAGSARELWPTARALASTFRVFVPDQRGHGRSTRLPEDVSRAAFVADTVAVIERLTDHPVRLVGQSMGGHTALLTAAERPDLVDRLLLLETHPGGGDPAQAAEIGAFLASWPVPFSSPEDARAFLGDRSPAPAWIDDLEQGPEGLRPRFDPGVMEHVLRAVLEPRWAEWERLAVPTRAVFADQGMFTPAQKAEMVARRPGTDRVDLVGVGHDAHLDDHRRWVRALRAWLTRPL